MTVTVAGVSSENRRLVEQAVKSGVAAGIATAVASSTEVDYRGMSTGIIHLPATTSVTTITYYVSSTSGGTFNKVYTASAGAALSSAVVGNATGNALAIPDELKGASFIKFVGDAAESAATVDLQA